MRHFTKIAERVDVAPLLREIDAVPERWLADTRRQRKVRCQRETLNIFLRAVRKPLPPGAKNGNDVHESRTTRMAAHFPETLAYCGRVARDLEGTLGRATVVMLRPGGRVLPHIDAGAYYAVRDHLHLVLRSSEGSPLAAGDETVTMRPGEPWGFDSKVRHSARNPSVQRRCT